MWDPTTTGYQRMERASETGQYGQSSHATSRLGVRKQKPRSKIYLMATKFLEYAASGIPHYWIVDPTTGQITVFELRVDEYIPIQKAYLNENRKCQLSPFGMELDLTKVFFYLL